MELKLIRTKLTRGIFCELYHRRKLVLYRIEIIPKKYVTLFSILADGRYTLRRSDKPGNVWTLELRAAGRRKPTFIHLMGDNIIMLPDCREPLMMQAGAGKEVIAERVYENIKSIILPALLRKRPIGIKVETGH